VTNTHLNHNSLVSVTKKRKVVTKGVIIKGVYFISILECPKFDGFSIWQNGLISRMLIKIYKLKI